MPREGVVSDFHVLLQNDPGATGDAYTFTLQIDTPPVGEGAPIDTVIACTIDGGDPAPFICEDTATQCYESGDGILVKVVSGDQTINNPGGMTWTAIFIPRVCP